MEKLKINIWIKRECNQMMWNTTENQFWVVFRLAYCLAGENNSCGDEFSHQQNSRLLFGLHFIRRQSICRIIWMKSNKSRTMLIHCLPELANKSMQCGFLVSVSVFFSSDNQSDTKKTANIKGWVQLSDWETLYVDSSELGVNEWNIHHIISLDKTVSPNYYEHRIEMVNNLAALLGGQFVPNYYIMWNENFVHTLIVSHGWTIMCGWHVVNTIRSSDTERGKPRCASRSTWSNGVRRQKNRFRVYQLQID